LSGEIATAWFDRFLGRFERAFRDVARLKKKGGAEAAQMREAPW